jgi:hypothetical protein
MTNADPGEPLIAAVRRTLRQACDVSVRMRTAAIPMMDEFAPGLSEDGVQWTGTADFLSDRARLMLDTNEMRFDGSRSYMLMRDGRWQLTEGEVGTWGMFHPRYPLEAILQARERVVVLGERRFRVELDRDELSALSDAGVSPDWRPLAEVVLSDGIARTVQLGLTDRAVPQTSMVIVFEYEPVDQLPAIELPAMTDTITSADWIGEQETPGRSRGD